MQMMYVPVVVFSRVRSAQRWLVILLVGFAVMLTVSGPAAAQKKFIIGAAPIASGLQLYVAKDKGMFKELGYKAVIKPMRAGSASVPAVESGDVNFIMANIVTLLLAREKGFDLQIVTPGVVSDRKNPIAQLVVRKDDPIKDLKGLEGRKFGVPTLGPNIISLAMYVLAKKQGVDIKKFIMLEVPIPQSVPALKQKRIDAFVGPEPFTTIPVITGVGRILGDPYGAIAPTTLITGQVAKRSWIKAHRKDALDFHTAVQKATDYIKRHPDEMYQVIANNTRIKEGLARKMNMPWFPKAVERAHIQPVIDAAAKFKFIKKSYDARALLADFVSLK